MSIALGAFILCMAGGACRPPQEPGKPGKLVPDAPPQHPMEQSVEAAERPSGPIRVSRTFFEEPRRPLMGELSITGDPESSIDGVTQVSPVVWKKYAPDPLPSSAINPNEKPIADFRDYTACVEPVGLCFRVMPDVSSVGLNARDIRPDQLRTRVAEAWNVAESEVKLRFLGADRGDDWVKASFQVDAPRSAQLHVKIWQ